MFLMKIKLVDTTLLSKDKTRTLNFYRALMGEGLSIKDNDFFFGLKDKTTGFDFAIVPTKAEECNCLCFYVSSIEEGVTKLKDIGVKETDIERWTGAGMVGLFFKDCDGRKAIMIEDKEF